MAGGIDAVIQLSLTQSGLVVARMTQTLSRRSTEAIVWSCVETKFFEVSTQHTTTQLSGENMDWAKRRIYTAPSLSIVPCTFMLLNTVYKQ